MNKIKHYVCRRIKLYNFLSDNGFVPESVRTDIYNPKYKVWIYVETDQLRSCVEEYYGNR